MSNFKVETWRGHWYAEGMVFDTRAEAVSYAEMLSPMEAHRVTETNDPANYRFMGGKLVPGKKRFDFEGATWEEYIKHQSGG